MSNLPEKVRVDWPEHRLHGAELPVHGWHHYEGRIQLSVTLTDGSRGYFPADMTNVWEGIDPQEAGAGVLTAEGVAKLRALVEALRARRRDRRRRAKESK